MKKFAIALLIVSSVATSAYGYKGQMREERLNDVLEELEIDESRAAEVRTIMSETRTQHREIMDKAHEEAKALRETSQEQLSSILTEDEMKSFKKAMREGRKHFRKAGKQCQGRGKKFKDSLTPAEEA